MRAPLQHRASAFKAIMERIGKDAPSSHAYISRLKSAVGPLGASVTALVNLHATVDPTQTKAHHDKKVITTAAKLQDRRKQTLADTQVVLNEGMRDISSRINAKVNLKEDSFAQEIRAAFRTMSPADRAENIAQWIKSNNGPTLAAITQAPAMLSGVSEAQQRQYRDAIVQMHAPAECVEEAALLDAFQNALHAMDVAAALSTDLNNPGRLAEIDLGVNAAAAAESAFNNPASGAA